jgi:hypothetical protein
MLAWLAADASMTTIQGDRSQQQQQLTRPDV